MYTLPYNFYWVYLLLFLGSWKEVQTSMITYIKDHPIWYQQHLSKAADENSVMKTTLHSTYLNFSNSFLSLNLFILSLFLFILFCWPNEKQNAADNFYLMLLFKLIVINIYMVLYQYISFAKQGTSEYKSCPFIFDC